MKLNRLNEKNEKMKVIIKKAKEKTILSSKLSSKKKINNKNLQKNELKKETTC